MSITKVYEDVLEISGVKIPLAPKVITPRVEELMRSGGYGGGICRVIGKTLRAGDRVLELGAGIGLISSVVAQVEDLETVTAVEANPQLIPLITETFRLNGVSDVTLRNGVVVASHQKRTPFYLREDFATSSLAVDAQATTKRKHLPCFNIGELIEETNPTVIICDIVGGELGLFEGVDLSAVRSLLLTVHPEIYGDEALDDITRSLKTQGLVLDVSEKLDGPVKTSTLHCYHRGVKRPKPRSQALPFESGKPELTGLQDKPWDPQTARFLVTTCMKDEGPFILEWLAWHKSIGIQDFVIFTNDCTDGTHLLLQRLDEMGELRHLPNPALASASPAFQPYALAYTPYLAEFSRADFYISMDVDEFINIRLGTGQMSDLLTKTGPFDALSISELNHGSNHVEGYEPGFVIDQFPKHQREKPGKFRAHRGVKTIVRLGEKLKHIRNHRPDLHSDTGPVSWLDGAGRPLQSLHEDPTQNGIDVRGSYDLVSLDHFALRSLHSYLVKMFRGDVVVKDKMVSQRYWRNRDRNSDLTSSFERQRKGFEKVYKRLLKDKTLAALHEECCTAHQDRISELLGDPVFQLRKQWIHDNIWSPEVPEAKDD